MLIAGKYPRKGGDLMPFDTKQHQTYGGIDLHARTMDVYILDQSGAVLGHRHRKTDPQTCLKVLAPYREGLVVAVACLFTWSWLADLCADEGLPCVLGHALYLQAIHGGKAKNDQLDSHKLAAWLRGGPLPQAYVSPARMRATRAVLRRRRPLAHKRAELLAHVQNTNSQYNLPAIGKKIAYKANREGGAERFADPAGQKSLAVDLARITYYDELLRDVERTIVHAAKHPDANTRYLLQTVPGLGTILSLVLRYAIHVLNRLPRGQDFVSYGRRVKCAKASGGKRLGTSGATSGTAHLKGAFSAAAVLFRRDHPDVSTLLILLANCSTESKLLHHPFKS
jgi:transposase